ncbi:MAG: hypothetical protein HWE16_01135 [Gammaproteobacteria bacterium]|nr:hypothetical protein [Gammaproteobacteria bacterium]
MVWSFEIKEQSPGNYFHIAERCTGNKISFYESEVSVKRLLLETYLTEREIVKLNGLAIFNIFKDYFKTNHTKYDDKAFGSWIIKLNQNEIVYDGKDYEIRFNTNSYFTKSENDLVRLFSDLTS